MTESQKRTRANKVAHVLALWFGCGRVPLAPGTAGSLGAFPLYWIVRPLGPIVVGVVALVVAAVGIWAASIVARDTREKDPQEVVIDEVTGMLLTLAAAPPGWLGSLVAFVAFRIFDQWKPWPARTLERKLPGGWGIVMDDVAAGMWGGLLLLAARQHGFL